MATNITFYWHDYETGGVDPKRDWPLQFAGIRTDANLQIIDEPQVFYCKPSCDQLPYPEACLITGITPQQALTEGVIEAEFFARIHQQLSKPNTCGVGYNSLRFDDEVTRYGLYRNFYDPYEREWKNGCSRWDIIDMLRVARCLRPEGINWPLSETGDPSLRLEELSVANGIEHSQAHDALSDVYATIAMASLVREKQPKLFNYLFTNRGKRQIQPMLDVQTHKPVLHISSRYPVKRGNAAIISPLASHPVNSNSVIVWDLRYNPEALMELEAEEIKKLLYTPREQLDDNQPVIALKQVHINKCPVVLPAAILDSTAAASLEIDGNLCRTHLKMIRAMPSIQRKIAEIYTESGFEPETDPDMMLYSGGFFSDYDRNLMQQILSAEVAELPNLQLPFQDKRLEEMLLRYKARNYPECLTPDEHLRWQQYCCDKLLRGTNKHLSMEDFYQRLNALYSEQQDRNKSYILEELAAYAESIYPMEA